MSGQQSQYSIGLDKTPANFVPLTPLSFLARTAAVYPDHTSTVYEGRTFTWSQTYQRCRRFASYLAARNIGRLRLRCPTSSGSAGRCNTGSGPPKW